MLDQKQGLLSGQVPRTDAELCLLNDPCDLLLQPLRHFLAVPADDASEVVICARLQLHALLLSPLVLPLSPRLCQMDLALVQPQVAALPRSVDSNEPCGSLQLLRLVACSGEVVGDSLCGQATSFSHGSDVHLLNTHTILEHPNSTALIKKCLVEAEIHATAARRSQLAARHSRSRNCLWCPI